MIFEKNFVQKICDLLKRNLIGVRKVCKFFWRLKWWLTHWKIKVFFIAQIFDVKNPNKANQSAKWIFWPCGIWLDERGKVGLRAEKNANICRGFSCQWAKSLIFEGKNRLKVTSIHEGVLPVLRHTSFWSFLLKQLPSLDLHFYLEDLDKNTITHCLKIT